MLEDAELDAIGNKIAAHNDGVYSLYARSREEIHADLIALYSTCQKPEVIKFIAERDYAERQLSKTEDMVMVKYWNGYLDGLKALTAKTNHVSI